MLDVVEQFGTDKFLINGTSNYFSCVLPAFIGILNSIAFLSSNKEAQSFLIDCWDDIITYLRSIFRSKKSNSPAGQEKDNKELIEDMDDELSHMFIDSTKEVVAFMRSVA